MTQPRRPARGAAA